MEDSCHRAKHTSITNHNVLLKCHLKPYLAKLLKKVQSRLQQYLKGQRKCASAIYISQKEFAKSIISCNF